MNNLNRLQKQEILKENISKIKFTTILYKTATEILLQPNQTYKEKFIELTMINIEYKGLIDIKLDGGVGITEARKKTPNININEEEIFKELLLMDIAREEGRYGKIISL